MVLNTHQAANVPLEAIVISKAAGHQQVYYSRGKPQCFGKPQIPVQWDEDSLVKVQVQD